MHHVPTDSRLGSVGHRSHTLGPKVIEGLGQSALTSYIEVYHYVSAGPVLLASSLARKSGPPKGPTFYALRVSAT